MAVPHEAKQLLRSPDLRVHEQPSFMPQSTGDYRLGSLPSEMKAVGVPLTPGESTEEKYKLMERFCRQSWINHGMIGGGLSAIVTSGALYLAQRRSVFFIFRYLFQSAPN